MADDIAGAPTRHGDGEILEALKAYLESDDGITVSLFQQGFVPSYESLESNFAAEIADFTGFTPVAVTAWLGPFTGVDGIPYIRTAPVAFTVGAGPVTGNVIGGVYVIGVDGEILNYALVQDGISMLVTGQQITVEMYRYADGRVTFEVVS